VRRREACFALQQGASGEERFTNRAATVTSVNSGNELDPGKLDVLLHRYGIASEFIEFSGNVAHIPLANRLHILGTMGVKVDTGSQLDSLLHARELASFTAMLPQVLVLAEGGHKVGLWLDSSRNDAILRWQLLPEGGALIQGECLPESLPLLASHAIVSRNFGQRELSLPQLPAGYHRLTVSCGEQSRSCLLIVAPAQTWQPDSLQQGKKLWGLSTQLYSLRSDSNWGMGDFADLLELVGHAAAYKAGFILLNPLHALDLRYPENASPYSPDDRRFLNPLYIAPQLCADFQAESVQTEVQSTECQQELARLRAALDVDYAAVHALKFRILVLLYRSFGMTQTPATESAAAQLQAFINDGGDALLVFAAHQAAHFSESGTALGEIGFHLWLQWQAQEQLQACQQAAVQAGMPLGLIRDLAVGSNVDGCEVLTNRELFCTAARIGAPPDNFNPDGQNWGLPPLLPDKLLDTRCALFIALLRSNMQSCGALRIDHVMALMRLWWCPDDGSNAAGAYVHYPVDVLFAVLRLESRRNRCMVIGEDLGVVPPAIRAYLEQGLIYSNAVFYFEKYDGWHFRKPEHYKEMALAMIANHDVPPLRAWWNGSDLLLRRSIGLIASDDKLQQEQDYRNGEKGQLLQWLAEQDLLPAPWQDRGTDRLLDATLSLAIVQACSRVSARLLSLQLDDLAGVDTPVNIPGTSWEYPNWRRKIPVALDAIFTNTDAQSLLQVLSEARSA
jgi:4-alpha-glucanotransferase